jgi:hypothetical protein
MIKVEATGERTLRLRLFGPGMQSSLFDPIRPDMNCMFLVRKCEAGRQVPNTPVMTEASPRGRGRPHVGRDIARQPVDLGCWPDEIDTLRSAGSVNVGPRPSMPERNP